MIVTPIKTNKVLPSEQTIFELLDIHLPKIKEKSFVAISSKIIALCEGRVAPLQDTNKDELVKQEADYFLSAKNSRYGFNFSVTQNTLIPMAGIDESNGDGNYVLWPENVQASANDIRKYLRDKFNLKEVGVIITDSTCMPLRWGTIGIALGYSGFRATNDYVGKNDLFGRPFKISKSGVASNLAATSVVVMGEGAEQTPIAVIEDVPFVEFRDRDPTEEELELFYIKDKDEDLFAPFLNAVEWQKGKRNS